MNLGTCSPIPGFTSTLSTDFTTLTSSLNKDWVVASDEPFSTSSTNGAVLSMKKRGDAPYIWTSGYFQYGHVDIVLQTAPGVGVITAAVLYSDTLDEVDLEFSGNDYGSKTPTFETNYFGKGVIGTYDRSTSVSPGFNTTVGFHTYSLDWTADSLTWFVDGTVVRTLLKANCDSDEHQYPQTPSQLHVGVWDGGDPSNEPGVIQWAGGQTDLKEFPYTAYVRSVKIVPASSCAYYNYTDTTGSGGSVKCLSALPNPSTKTSNSTMSSSINTNSQTQPSSKEASGITKAISLATSSESAPGVQETSSAASAATISLGSSSVRLTTNTVYKTSIYSTVLSCNPSVTNCPADQSHKSTMIVTDIVVDYTTICPVTESTSSSSKATPSSIKPTTIPSSELTSSNAVPFYITPVSSSSSNSPSGPTPTSHAHSSSTSPHTSSASTPPRSSSSPSSSVASATLQSPSLTKSTVYSTNIHTIISCASGVKDCPAESTILTTEVVVAYTTVCPVSTPGMNSSAANIATLSVKSSGTSSPVFSTSFSTFIPDDGAPGIYSSVGSTVTVTSGVTTVTSPGSTQSTSKPSKATPETYSSGPTTVVVSSDVTTAIIHHAPAADTGSNSASMSMVFGTASPSLYNIDTDLPSAVVPSPLLPSLPSGTGSSTDATSQPSGASPDGSSPTTPADQTSGASSPATADVQPAVSAGTTTVRSAATFTTTVSLTTTIGTPTGLITTEIYSSSPSDTVVMSSATDDILGTNLSSARSTTVNTSAVLTPTTDTTASVVAQPPVSGQVQDGNEGSDTVEQVQPSATGYFPSSVGNEAPPSGVAGAGTGTGIGALRTPVGPSSTMSTVHIAESGRNFGSGWSLAVTVAGVVGLLCFH